MKIETKFDIGQEVYVIDYYDNFYHKTIKEIVPCKNISIEINKGGISYITDEGLYSARKTFATQEEAEAKLKELKEMQ